MIGWFKEVNGYRLCNIYSMESSCDMVIDKFEIASMQDLVRKYNCSKRFVRRLFQTLGFSKFRVISRSDLFWMSSGSEEIPESDFFINKSDVELLGLELAYEEDLLPSLNYLIKRGLETGTIWALIEVIPSFVCDNHFWVIIYYDHALPIIVYPEEQQYNEVKKVIEGGEL